MPFSVFHRISVPTGKHWIRNYHFCVSMVAVQEQSLRSFGFLENIQSRKVVPSIGAEQEYFLIDRNKYLQRKDLIYTGAYLFGAMQPKGQELDAITSEPSVRESAVS